MTSRTARLSLVVLVVLALSACSAPGGSDETSSVTGGTIEFGRNMHRRIGPSVRFDQWSDVVLPSAFEHAGVEDAAVADGEGQNAVDVTFDKDGAAVLHTLRRRPPEPDIRRAWS